MQSLIQGFFHLSFWKKINKPDSEVYSSYEDDGD